MYAKKRAVLKGAREKTIDGRGGKDPELRNLTQANYL
jgi:hypothetical protein